jgi:hypothetical protein
MEPAIPQVLDRNEDAVPVVPLPSGWTAGSARDTDSHPKAHRWTQRHRDFARDHDGLDVGVLSCKRIFGYRGAGDTRRKRITQRARGASVAVTRFVVLIRKRLGMRGANSRGAPGNHAFYLRDLARVFRTNSFAQRFRTHQLRTAAFTLAPSATLVQRDTFR